jgi:hypothetical protein
MKKYFLSFMALVLALGFSAFTAPKKIQKTNQALYWYEVSSDMTTVDDDDLLYPSQIEASAAINLTECEGNTSNDCARGFTSLLSAPTQDVGTEQIKRNQ